MYNRYIPQPDGTYRRNRMQEPAPEPKRPQAPPEPPCPEPEIPLPPPCQGCVHSQVPRRPLPPKPKKPGQNGSIGSFLKQLLPRDFDTEDLLIVLLLLLMAGDCQEDQNTALLTLVLYLFL